MRAIRRLEDGYVGTLAWTLRHKGWTFVLVVAFLGIGLLPFFTGMVESAIFSGTLNRRLYLEYEFDDFLYKSQVEKRVNIVEDVLQSNAEEFNVGSVYSFYAENRAGTVISLDREDLSDDEIKELRTEIRDAIPEMAGVRAVFSGEAFPRVSAQDPVLDVGGVRIGLGPEVPPVLMAGPCSVESRGQIVREPFELAARVGR